MKTMSVSEAKANFSKMLDCVAQGEHITITKYGVPMALLEPPDSPRKCSVEEAIVELSD